MLYTKSNALQVAEATVCKVKEVSRPVAKFVVHILELWLSMNCRYVFTNMERWGGRMEKSYRQMFQKCSCWFSFNYELVKHHAGVEIICVFAPCFVKKSGKKTYGVGQFWSGVAGRALRGLEVGCLCLVDVAAGTALHAFAKQTPSVAALQKRGKTLVDHYVSVIQKQVRQIVSLTRYLAVDGYFAKKEFIHSLVKEGLHIITKMRQDANLRYLYQGEPKGGKGRPKLYAGKVDVKALDKKKAPLYYRDKEVAVYAAVLYAVQFKRRVLVAFVYYKGKTTPQIIMSTDVEMEALLMCRYYGLRFQVEFLIRDAKQHTGLEDCQARSKEKLHTHFNVALTAVSLAKCAYWLPLPEEQRASFSMADVKMLHMNELMTQRIFQNLDLDLSDRKIKQLYDDCLNFGRLRA
jgi:hypothetical protein